jgi:hypothetical protein
LSHLGNNTSDKADTAKNHAGSGGKNQGQSSSGSKMKEMPAEVLRAIQEEGMNEAQIFQLLREMEMVDDEGEFI